MHGHTHPLSWPPRDVVLPPGRRGRLGEHLKYALRLAWTADHRPSLLALLSRQPLLSNLFQAFPRLYHVPLSAFLDRRLSAKRRFQVMLNDLQCAQLALGSERLTSLAAGQPLPLFECAPGLQLCLSVNEINPHEGLWAIVMKSPEGQRIFNLSFGFLDPDTVLIGSLQGSPDGLDQVRQATKDAHGLRPPYLLIEILRLLVRAWGKTRLLGIDPEHHVKGRWNQRHRLRFEYRELWGDLGAHRQSDGFWRVPLETETRDLQTVPSRKRSTYRRRADMLQTAGQALSASFAPA